MKKATKSKIERLRKEVIDVGLRYEWVYLIDYGEGMFKIGRTSDIARRLSTLQSHYPYKLQVIYAFICKDANTIEHRLHKMFKDVRLRSEWFKLSDADVKFVSQLDQYNCEHLLLPTKK